MKDVPPGDFLKPVKENKKVNVPDFGQGALGDVSKDEMNEGYCSDGMKKRRLPKYIWDGADA